MYKVGFYLKNGKSDIIEYLDKLKIKSEKSKEARIIRNKILSYIKSLELYGTRVGEPIVKHIEDDMSQTTRIVQKSISKKLKGVERIRRVVLEPQHLREVETKAKKNNLCQPNQ